MIVSPALPLPASERLAAEVARGVCRLLHAQDLVPMAEVPVGVGRRADLMALDPRGRIVIVEIKVSRADLLGDAKWRDYLDHCDRFYWAVPGGFDLTPFDEEAFLPQRAGLIVADRYDAAILREGCWTPMAAAARKACTLAFARRAGRRLLAANDPDAEWAR